PKGPCCAMKMYMWWSHGSANCGLLGVRWSVRNHSTVVQTSERAPISNRCRVRPSDGTGSARRGGGGDGLGRGCRGGKELRILERRTRPAKPLDRDHQPDQREEEDGADHVVAQDQPLPEQGGN